MKIGVPARRTTRILFCTNSTSKRKLLAATLLGSICCQLVSIPAAHAGLKTVFAKGLPAGYVNLPPPPDSRTDLSSSELSPDALQLFDILGITQRLRDLQQLRDKARAAYPNKLAAEEREDMRDLRQDLGEIIERTRLEIALTTW